MSEMTIEEALKIAEDAKDSMLPRGEALQVLSGRITELEGSLENRDGEIEEIKHRLEIALTPTDGSIYQGMATVTGILQETIDWQKKEIEALKHDLSGAMTTANGYLNDLNKCAAGEWLPYPENKPEINNSPFGYFCKCKIPGNNKIEGKEYYFEVCFFDGNEWADSYGHEACVIEFSEIRG